jgi:hypothetical protein
MFIISALSISLLIDSYQAWALTGSESDCRPPLTVLFFSHRSFSVNPMHADEQAVLAWQRQVTKKYGRLYANFEYAGNANTGIGQCYPQLDDGPSYCGFASGKPCRRIGPAARPLGSSIFGSKIR